MSTNEEKKQIRKEVLLDFETKDLLEKLAEKYALSEAEIIRDLIRKGSQYRILESNFKDLLIEDELQNYAKKEQIRLKGELLLIDEREKSKQKDREVQVKLRLIGEFLKTRTDVEKRDFFESQLHLRRSIEGEDYRALPVQVKDGYEVFINAIKIKVKAINKDGFPVVDYNQDRLIQCELGFHVKGSVCDCDLLRTCTLIINERAEKVASRF